MVLTVGCGGPHGVSTADLAGLPQPTPDATLDAVVRGGSDWVPAVMSTPTPPPPVARPTPRPSSPRPAPTPTRAAARSR